MKTQTIAERLAALPMFADLLPAQLDFIAGCAQNFHFAEDAFLLLEGHPVQAFYILDRGNVALEVSGANEVVTIQTLGEGDVLGWSWLVPPYTAHYDARALTPVSAVAFDAVCVRQKCERDPVFGYEIYKRFSQVIAERLMAASMQLVDLYQ
jgi:CRP/FNR family cyclic AMP-dependent transcriptional regulator